MPHSSRTLTFGLAPWSVIVPLLGLAALLLGKPVGLALPILLGMLLGVVSAAGLVMLAWGASQAMQAARAPA